MLNLLFSTSNTPLIFRDLKWVDRAPVLVVEHCDGNKPRGVLTHLALTPGAYLGFSSTAEDVTAADLSTDRYCSGYAKASTEYVGFEHLPCATGATITSGKQCPRCLALDEFAAMHGVHRGTRLAPAAQAYASLEHWLYIATFPDGTSKVGTASAHSKPRRLDEQAVALATYIGHATDGAQVRIWEDLVSQETALVQAKQARAKYRAWTQPLPWSDLQDAHSKAVALASWSLQEAALFEDYIEPDQIIAEAWQPTGAMRRVYASLKDTDQRLDALPSLLGAQAGFYVTGAAGKFLSVHLGDESTQFLVNLTELANKVLVPSSVISQAPTSQTSLF